MEITDQRIRKLLILNYTATFIIIVVLFYTFYTFKQLHYFIVGIVGIFLMIISSCFQCYFCRILIMQPFGVTIRKFVLLLCLMYLGLVLLALTVTLNKSWNVSFILTILIQVIYSFISFYALYKLIRNRPFTNYQADRSENSQVNNDNRDQISGAYSPGFQNDGGIFIPPEPFTNYDSEYQQNSSHSNNFMNSSNDQEFVTEIGRGLTDGLNYTQSSPIIFSKPNSLAEFYKRTSSVFDDYGLASNNDIITTGAVSEYEILYGQNATLEDEQNACNPYANKHAESII